MLILKTLTLFLLITLTSTTFGQLSDLSSPSESSSKKINRLNNKMLRKKYIKKLNLSGKQINILKKNSKEVMKKNAIIKAKLTSKELELKKELSEEFLDFKKIQILRKEIKIINGEMIDLKLNSNQETHHQLTPNQQKKISEIKKHHPKLSSKKKIYFEKNKEKQLNRTSSSSYKNNTIEKKQPYKKKREKIIDSIKEEKNKS